MKPSSKAPPIPPTTPPMIFFSEEEMPLELELPSWASSAALVAVAVPVVKVTGVDVVNLPTEVRPSTTRVVR